MNKQLAFDTAVTASNMPPEFDSEAYEQGVRDGIAEARYRIVGVDWLRGELEKFFDQLLAEVPASLGYTKRLFHEAMQGRDRVEFINPVHDEADDVTDETLAVVTSKMRSVPCTEMWLVQYRSEFDRWPTVVACCWTKDAAKAYIAKSPDPKRHFYFNVAIDN